MSDSLQPHEPQQARPPFPSPTPGVYSNPCPLSGWCHPTISFSEGRRRRGQQSFPASGSFQMSQFLASGGQSIGVSALASFLPKNTQGRSPLEWTGWMSLQSKGLSRDKDVNCDVRMWTKRVKMHLNLSCYQLQIDCCILCKSYGIHSSVLVWRIPGTGEPGGLLSMGSHRVGHDWSDLAQWFISEQFLCR